MKLTEQQIEEMAGAVAASFQQQGPDANPTRAPAMAIFKGVEFCTDRAEIARLAQVKDPIHAAAIEDAEARAADTKWEGKPCTPGGDYAVTGLCSCARVAPAVVAGVAAAAGGVLVWLVMRRP